MNIGFVTSAEIGAITADDALTASALADVGVTVRPVVWDTGEIPKDIDAFVLRSPWNYHLDPEAFLGWLDRAHQHAAVCNAPKLVRWNSHKGYLKELERAGIPIADTVICKRGVPSNLLDVMEQHGWKHAVVKPAISASSFMTGIVSISPNAILDEIADRERVIDDGQHLLDRILETRDALVQPFMPEIFRRGERCMIFIGGEFSHAVQKAPFTDACGGGRPAVADSSEIEIGQKALSVLPQTPLYARVDLLRGDDGADRLMEFELIDPELYFRFGPESPRRFASALTRLVCAV